MAKNSLTHGWTVSDDESDSGDDLSLLPVTSKTRDQSNKKGVYSSPSRIREKADSGGKVAEKKMCPFGNRCYRKLAAHLEEYMHPHKEESRDADSGENPAKKQKFSNESRDPAVVWKQSSPLNFLLTTVSGLPDKFNYFHESTPLCSLHIKDILSKDFGNLIETAQFTYLLDAEWFLDQLPPDKQQIPILFVHGGQGADYFQINRADYPNLKTCKVDLPPFGTHHTKMMFLRYQIGIRVIIHTANLAKKDWHQKTQGMWISPVFPPKENSRSDQKVPFSFKHDLLDYLNQYRNHPDLLKWKSLIESHDLSTANVVLVGSVPGRHKDSSLHKWGHMRLTRILGAFVEQAEVSGWPVIGQFSSIGSLGADKDKWLCKEWLKSMSSTRRGKSGLLSYPSTKSAPLKLIFPSVENVRMSLEGYPAGGSIPYGVSVAKKQVWLTNFFHQWKSRYLVRTQAAPHIKTYTRVNRDFSKAAWFLLTSSNLSKAAWGGLEKKDTQLSIRSYELGVLFLPQRFFPDAGRTSFDLVAADDQTRPELTLPFSTPLVQYSEQDEPWIWDIPHKKFPDRHGNVWSPS